jgi:hypothetical protein
MDVQLPEWWTDPEHCGNGHPWGPGRVLLSWMPCQCDPARKARPRSPGHRVIACRAPGCEWTVHHPPHDPASALGVKAAHAATDLAYADQYCPLCWQSHGVCVFTGGSLYCIRQNCPNPHHRRPVPGRPDAGQ